MFISTTECRWDNRLDFPTIRFTLKAGIISIACFGLAKIAPIALAYLGIGSAAQQAFGAIPTGIGIFSSILAIGGSMAWIAISIARLAIGILLFTALKAHPA